MRLSSMALQKMCMQVICCDGGLCVGVQAKIPILQALDLSFHNSVVEHMVGSASAADR